MTEVGHPTDASATLLRAVRTGDRETARELWRVLADYDSAELAGALSDDARTAFWLNVYNAAVQDELRANPGRYDSRLRFFVGNRVTIAGHELSLNDIEHGILRRSKTVLGLGYLPRILQSRFERTHRVAELDPRIHFALNCGAASCPPVATYSRDALDDELTLASESYLTSEVVYDDGVVRVPKLFLWYRGDFGGRSGILDYLRTYGSLSRATSPKIRYRSYDWSLELENFLDDGRDSETVRREADASHTDRDDQAVSADR